MNNFFDDDEKLEQAISDSNRDLDLYIEFIKKTPKKILIDEHIRQRRQIDELAICNKTLSCTINMLRSRIDGLIGGVFIVAKSDKEKIK